MPSWSLQNFKNWIIFSHFEKIWQKKNIFCTGPPPPPELHISSETKSKFHVPGYMDLKKNQNSMYPGTWIWRKNKISCTRVHGFEEKTKFNVPGYMNLKKKFLCVAQAVGVARHKKKIFFWQFFSTCEKINQFWEFCKDQGGKI